MANSTKSLDALTGLRFIAAFAVLIEHGQKHLSIPEFGLPLGAFAVSFFFLLSGFILTYAYDGRLMKTADTYRFWLTRFGRIWPLPFMMMLVCIGGLWQWCFNTSDPSRYLKFGAGALLLQSWVPDPRWVFSINGVSWSISVEFFFYLLFPILFSGGFKFFRWKYTAVGIFTLIGLLGVHVAEVNLWLPDWLHTSAMVQANPLFRLFEFATGMFVGFNFNRLTISKRAISFGVSTILEVTAIIGVLAFAYLISSEIHLPWLSTSGLGSIAVETWVLVSAPVLSFAWIVWVFARSTGVLARLLSTRPMIYLGEISFSFYMVHQFIILKLDFHFADSILVVSPWVAYATVSVLSLLASMLMFRLIEVPGKQLVLSLYDRKFHAMAEFGSAYWKNHIRSPIVAMQILLLIGITTAIPRLGQHYPPVSKQMIAQLLDSNSVGIEGVEFDNGATLHALRFEEVSSGNLLVTTLWTQVGETDMKRFVHLCDSDGDIVRHAQQSAANFRVRTDGEYWIDQLIVTPKQQLGIHSLGLGFFHPRRGTSVVEEGDRSMNGHRLDFILPQVNARVRARLDSIAACKIGDDDSVDFKGCAQLLGYKMQVQHDGLLLETVWDCKQDLLQERFLHICDDRGNIIKHARQKATSARFQAADEPWLDQVLIPFGDLNDAKSIGVGFYSQQTGSVPVSGGCRSMNNHRLDLALPVQALRFAMNSLSEGKSTKVR